MARGGRQPRSKKSPQNEDQAHGKRPVRKRHDPTAVFQEPPKVTLTKDSKEYLRSEELPHWGSIPHKMRKKYPLGTHRKGEPDTTITFLEHHYHPSSGPWAITQSELDRWSAMVNKDRVVPFIATGVPLERIGVIKRIVPARMFSSYIPLELASMAMVFHQGYRNGADESVLRTFSHGAVTKMFPGSSSPISTAWRLDLFLQLVNRIHRQSGMDVTAAAEAIQNRPLPRIFKLVDSTNLLSQLNGADTDPVVLGEHLTVMSKGKWSSDHVQMWMSLPVDNISLLSPAIPLMSNAKTRGPVLEELQTGLAEGVPVDWIVSMFRE